MFGVLGLIIGLVGLFRTRRPESRAAHGRAVVACYLVSGTSDFLVEAAIPDLASYEQLLLAQILAIPAIVEAQSTFAIRTILSRGPLPLDHWRH